MYVMLSSLGCDKNLVESEMMLGLMADAGYTLTDDEINSVMNKILNGLTSMNIELRS